MINPFYHAAFLWLLGASAFMLGLPEQWAAVITLVYLAAVAAKQPGNGVMFIIMCAPFFLGEPGWPYFWFLEVMVYLLLVASIFHPLIRKSGQPTPMRNILLVFLAAAALSLPLDLKESHLNFWVFTYGELLEFWKVGQTVEPFIRYLRTLMNIISAVALFIVSYKAFSNASCQVLDRFVKALTVHNAIVILCGIALLHDLFPKSPDTWHYLSLSLVGHKFQGLTAFGYNEQYIVLYLALASPLALYSVVMSHSKAEAVGYMACLALALYGMLQGAQRAGALGIVIVIVMSIVVYMIHYGVSGRTLLKTAGITLGAVVAIAVGLSLSRFSMFERFSVFQMGTDPRYPLWVSAVRMMMQSPLAGVGLGGYTEFYRGFAVTIQEADAISDYFRRAVQNVHFYPINAMSHYFQTLANQGIIGVIAWGLLLIAALQGAYTAFRDEADVRKKALLAAFVMSIVMWLGLGVPNAVMEVRAYELMFWVFLAFSLSLRAPFMVDLKLSRTAGRGMAIMAAIIAVFQAYQVYSFPEEEGISRGFFNWERQPDGTGARWMGKRAYTKIDVKGNRLCMPVSAPLPGLERRPQSLTIWWLESKKIVTIDKPGWQDVCLNANGANQDKLTLKFKADYTLNPAKEGVSGDKRNLGVYLKEPVWTD